jgi:hypothetical protein
MGGDKNMDVKTIAVATAVFAASVMPFQFL